MSKEFIMESYKMSLTTDQWDVIREMCADFANEVGRSPNKYRDNFNAFEGWIKANGFYKQHLTTENLTKSIH